MKKILLVAVMLSIAGTAAYASLINQPTPTAPKPVECSVKGKTKWVQTVDACKALGGHVVEAKKVA